MYDAQVVAFGPLWEECVVRVGCAAALVRAAACCGGRAVRAGLPLYLHAYTERARELAALVAAHSLPTTFEAFVERMRDPVPAGPASHGNPAPVRPTRRLRTKLDPDS